MNKKLKSIVLNPVRYYSQLIKNNKKGIDLTLGEGHFVSPFNAKLKAYEALLANDTKYSLVEGNESLRKLLIEKYYPKYDYKNEIIITNGSTQGFFSVLLSIINSKQDEVIIIAPYYPAYEKVVKLLGGKVVVINSSKSGFKISPEVLGNYVTGKTKAIIINEPCNPTGVIYSIEEKKVLLEYFKDKDFLIIVDEVYSQYTSESFISFSSLITYDLKDRFIFINGLSKSHMMTGYRIGFVVCGKSLNNELKKINYLTVSCISSVMQKGAIGALEDDQFCKFVTKYYFTNLQTLKETLNNLNIEFVDANSGYYLFINVSKFGLSGEEFCKYFIDNYYTALVPGKLFGKGFDNYVRVSCCKDIKDISKFVNYILDFSEICEKM